MFALSYEASYNPYTLKKYIRIEVKGYIKNTKLNILNTKACSRKLEDNLVSEGFSKWLFDGLLEEGMVEDFGKTVFRTVTVVNVKHVNTKFMNLSMGLIFQLIVWRK